MRNYLCYPCRQWYKFKADLDLHVVHPMQSFHSAEKCVDWNIKIICMSRLREELNQMWGLKRNIARPGHIALKLNLMTILIHCN